jgi:hypothetical protein
MSTTHLCLVSDQPLPNLLPTLCPDLACKQVILLATPPMKDRSASLASVIYKHGIQPVQLATQSHDLVEFRRQITLLLGDYPEAILNATGGLKTMSIVAFDVFRDGGRPAFYVERDNRLIWLSPADRPGQKLPGVLCLDDYFAAFSQKIEEKSTKPLVNDGGLGLLARPSSLPKPGPGDRGRQFESLVFRAMKTALEEVGGQTEAIWGARIAGSSIDEFDVVAMHDNVLHLVECKHAGGNGFNAFLHKLENLRRQRGITARAALVTSASIQVDGGNSQRARENGILLLSRRDLPNLVNHLISWLSP